MRRSVIERNTDRAATALRTVRDPLPRPLALALGRLVRRTDRHGRKRRHEPRGGTSGRPGRASRAAAEAHDLGLPLLSVTRIGPDEPEAPAPDIRHLTSTEETS